MGMEIKGLVFNAKLQQLPHLGFTAYFEGKQVHVIFSTIMLHAKNSFSFSN